jgi:hypothetical protein
VKVAAIISSVDHFLGDNLSGRTSGYDLALVVEVEPLLLWLDNQLSDASLLGWVDNVVDHTFLVSDAISTSISMQSHRPHGREDIREEMGEC